MGLFLASVVYHHIFSNKYGVNNVENVPVGGKSGLCPRWCTFHTFCPHYFLVDGLFCSRVLFQHVFIIAVPCRSQTHHLAPLLKPWKSKLCLWITIHQNKFPLQPPQEALIREENLFSLYFLHFWPCFWSIGEPGLYLVCPFLPNWGI